MLDRARRERRGLNAPVVDLARCSHCPQHHHARSQRLGLRWCELERRDVDDAKRDLRRVRRIARIEEGHSANEALGHVETDIATAHSRDRSPVERVECVGGVGAGFEEDAITDLECRGKPRESVMLRPASNYYQPGVARKPRVTGGSKASDDEIEALLRNQAADVEEVGAVDFAEGARNGTHRFRSVDGCNHGLLAAQRSEQIPIRG